MGKDSKHQRTKGGVQPSNASRTAKLLEKTAAASSSSSSSSGGQATTTTPAVINSFLAASAELRSQQLQCSSSDKTSLVCSSNLLDQSPVVAGGLLLVDDLDLPPEVRLVLRKLLKKDGTTKVKALSELTQLIGENNDPQKQAASDQQQENLSSTILPHWSKLYPKLTQDDSRKVRELAQTTHTLVCKAVGKTLAKHLKHLMPHWFISQFDPYTPVASAARNSFASVFPSDTKRVDALRFCISEIVNHLKGNFEGVWCNGNVEDEGDVRVVVGSVMGVNELVGIGLIGKEVDDDKQQQHGDLIMDLLFGKALLSGCKGLFWTHVSKWDGVLLVKKPCLDLLTTISNSETLAHHINVQKTVALIKPASSSNHHHHAYDAFPSSFKLYTTLTCNGMLKPDQAKSMLMSFANSSFHHQATQIKTIEPVVLKIYEGLGLEEQQQTFLRSLLTALSKGLELEKSVNEKLGVVRLVIGGSLIKLLLLNEATTHEFLDFIVRFLKVFSSAEIPKALHDSVVGAVVPNDRVVKFYTDLFGVAELKGLLDTSELGLLVAGIVAVGGGSSRPTNVRSVRFTEQQQQQQEESLVATATTTEIGPNELEIIQKSVKYFISKSAYNPVVVLSRKLGKVTWESVDDIDIIDFDGGQHKIQDFGVRTKLILDLISVKQGNPKLLSHLSNLLEELQPNDTETVINFLKELTKFVHIREINKWVRMEKFTDRVRSLLLVHKFKSTTQQQQQQLTVLVRFIKELRSTELVGVLKDRLLMEREYENDDTFSIDLATVLVNSSSSSSSNEPDDDKLLLFEPLCCWYWDKYLEMMMMEQHHSAESTIIEDLCVNKSNLRLEVVGAKLDKAIETCDSCWSVDRLVAVAHKVVANGGGDGWVDWINVPEVNCITPAMLGFLGSSCYDASCVTGALLEQVVVVRGVGENERNHVVKCIVLGKLALLLQENSVVVTQALVRVLHARALVDVVNEMMMMVMTLGDQKNQLVNSELELELKTVCSRLIETLYLDKEAWKNLLGFVGRQSGVLWESGVATTVLLRYCSKSELEVVGKDKLLVRDGGAAAATPLDANVDRTLKLIKYGELDNHVEEVVAWILKLRTDSPDLFEFDVLYRNMNNYQLTSKLLFITLNLIRLTTTVDDDQELLSTLACWVAGWLKGVKYVEATRAWCYWVTLLCKSVKEIGVKGRDPRLPQFATEYVEFIAKELYGGIYRVFLELNHSEEEEEWSGRVRWSWWGAVTMSNVGMGLSSVPGGCLCSIEPSCMEIIDKFAPLVLNGINLPVRVASYRVLRKVRYEKDLPIVPPTIDQLIKSLVDNSDDGSALDKWNDSSRLVSYLLLWDSLLRIQANSNEFASYVRDQPHLLHPLLDTLFFSPLISIESAQTKHFEVDACIEPCSPISLLHLSCTVLQRALRNLPYTVRWWWNNQITKQRDRVFIEKFVVKHLSGKLAAEELKDAKVSDNENVTVHCHSGCNELIAHYRIEETNVTLSISLPLNHPLGPVKVTISDKKLHAKINQLLNTRSHSLSAGLKLWKETLDSLYKDVDECAICFFILHHQTKQLPKLACKTCRKKFHSSCLYKWFSTSNKSECPLCRNLF